MQDGRFTCILARTEDVLRKRKEVLGDCLRWQVHTFVPALFVI